MSFLPVFKIGIWNAWIFMSVFILQMLVIMFASKKVRERSHIPSEAKRNQFEKYTGIIANFVWLIALVYSIFLPFQLETIWFYIGLFVFIVGLILITIATFNFITAASDQVITKGVYKLSRHPMYLATFLICMGSGIASVSLLFILLSIIMAFCFYKEALIEERFCLNEYGSAYQEYLNRVPRYMGLLKRIK
ncbi:methyltransferase family protein [Bacteroidota bacterium]